MTNKWDDKKIEKLLNDLPDIQDTRSKEDVLSRLKQDNRFRIRLSKNRIGRPDEM